MDNNTKKVLSIDCGSTNFKAAVFDQQLHRLADCSTPVVYSILNEEKAEFDAHQLWQTTVDLIRQTCTEATIHPHQIAAISLTSQAQTFTFLDEDGIPLIPFISWIDHRAANQAELLQKKLGSDFHAHCSFAPPIAQLQVAKVLWLRQNRPELFDQLKSVVSLPTWLALKLAGIKAIDHNLAAMSGMYSMQLRNWWPQALDLCGLNHRQLPSLLNMSLPVRTQRPCKEFEFSNDLEVVFAGNDQTAGAFSNNCSKGRVVVTLGTALVAYRFAGENPGPYGKANAWGPYPRGGFYELSVRDQGCAALDWARNQLMPDGGTNDFFDCAQSATCNNRVLFYPKQMGTPSAWFGPQDKCQQALAVLEGIGFTLKQMIFDDLRAEASLTSVCVIGGGSKSDFWLQLIADIIDCPISRGYGDAVLGAAMMALPNSSIPKISKQLVWHPRKSTSAMYRNLYQGWIQKANC